eukprot:2032588-Amphidinium_carterae.1
MISIAFQAKRTALGMVPAFKVGVCSLLAHCKDARPHSLFGPRLPCQLHGGLSPSRSLNQQDSKNAMESVVLHDASLVTMLHKFVLASVGEVPLGIPCRQPFLQHDMWALAARVDRRIGPHASL